MPKIGESEFNWDSSCLAREYDRWIVCIDMDFIAHKEKLYIWMDRAKR